MGRLTKVFDQAKQSSEQKDEIFNSIEQESTKSLNKELTNSTKQENTKSLSQELVNLNFKVDVEIRRKIKQYAAKHDKSLKDVFEEAINSYIEQNP
jgi:predicted HicB family RNase H-like nuclease